jgi:hypothetical protein
MRDVQLFDVRADDTPSRNDYIIGRAEGRRGGPPARFVFNCRVDFAAGSVRSVDVRPR